VTAAYRAQEGMTQMATASDSRLNVAIVGLGYWGPNRLRVLSEAADAKVTWICDSDIERVERHAHRAPLARRSASLEEVLADEELDAAVLATPVFTHHALARQCLQAGKHVFVEKPLAASSGEARDLVEIAEQADRVLMCGHTFIYSPPVRKVREILGSGELGELHFISSSRVNLGPYRSDVSVLFDLGPHDFSILRFWLGVMPERVSAIGRDVISNGIADVAFVDLTFPDGLLAHVELSWLAPSKLRRTVVVGSEKMLVYEDGAAEPVRIFDSGIEYQDPTSYGEYQLSYRTGDIVSVRVDAEEPIVAEIVDFIGAVRDGIEPASGADLALDVIRTVEAAELSMSNQGAPTAVSASGAATLAERG
jgi:predicted dehydrogenase